jgi:hypothetical protein
MQARHAWSSERRSERERRSESAADGVVVTAPRHRAVTDVPEARAQDARDLIEVSRLPFEQSRVTRACRFECHRFACVARALGLGAPDELN